MLDCVRGECGVRLEDGPVYTWVAPFFVPEITCLEGNTDQHPKDESIGQDAKRLLRGTLKMWECKHIDVVKRPQLPNEKSATVILILFRIIDFDINHNLLFQTKYGATKNKTSWAV